MEVFKLEINEREWVMERKFLQSIKELSNKLQLDVERGEIPDNQCHVCLELPEFVNLLNGKSAKVAPFDFTKKEWEEPHPQPTPFSNNQERARSIRRYVREMFISGRSLSVASLSRCYPGLTSATMRRHIQTVVSDMNERRPVMTPFGCIRIEREDEEYRPQYETNPREIRDRSREDRRPDTINRGSSTCSSSSVSFSTSSSI